MVNPSDRSGWGHDREGSHVASLCRERGDPVVEVPSARPCRQARVVKTDQTPPDVEIVGAGFAGLACARTCAARGLRTVVWERKRDPGEAIHTTGLLVKEAADEEDPPLELTRRIHGVRLYGPSLSWIDLDAPGYYFLATDTAELMRTLAHRAEEAGAQIRCGRPFPGSRTGRILVGADGPRSRVAQDAGLGRNRRFLSGVEAEFVGLQGVEERLHVFLDSQLAPGYIAWVVPGVGITQIGLACRRPTRPDLGAFLRKLQGLFDFSRARRVGTRGGLIPVGGTVRPFATHDVVLVGDAGGSCHRSRPAASTPRCAPAVPPASPSRADSWTTVLRSRARSRGPTPGSS